MASARPLGLLSRLPTISSLPAIAAVVSSRYRPQLYSLCLGGAGCRESRRGLGRKNRDTLWGILVGLGAATLSGSSMAVASSDGRPSVATVTEEKVVAESNGAMDTDLVTEFMVNMSCQGCVKSVRSKVEPLEGVKSVDVDLENQVVRVLGSASIKNLTSAIEQSGRDARLIGQGLPSNFAISAAVAEFKGPEINGVVRFAQLTMELAKIDASFSGLTAGSHAWSINAYGDLTQGAASTGGIFDEETLHSNGSKGSDNRPLGDLGTLDVDSKGEAVYLGTKGGLRVSELIGRAVVVYENQDKSKSGITAAVIARSAGVGENYKRLCSCDGTVIWESSNNDFVKL